MKKTLYFDVETTGLDEKKNSIIQFAGIVEYGDEVVDSINIKFQPFDEAEIDLKSLEMCGFKPEELLEWMPHEEGFSKVKQFFDKHIDSFDKTDKFYPAGYNVDFDLKFLQEFFRYNKEKYGIGSYFNWRRIDPIYLVSIMEWKGKLKLENMKLATVCNLFKIPLKEAHDALADIEATRKLIKKLL